jgi:hypothetical protein
MCGIIVRVPSVHLWRNSLQITFGWSIPPSLTVVNTNHTDEAKEWGRKIRRSCRSRQDGTEQREERTKADSIIIHIPDQQKGSADQFTDDDGRNEKRARNDKEPAAAAVCCCC